VLTSNVRRFLAALVALCLVSAGVFAGTAAVAAGNNCWTDESGNVICDVEATDPGNPETPGGGSGTGPAGFTPGPKTCTYRPFDGEAEEIPCTVDGGWWSNSEQCYWFLKDPQPAPPPGKDASVGAWYNCSSLVRPDCNISRDCSGFDRWLTAPPPGINRYTPAQAAGMLARSFILRPIEIGMAPQLKVHTDDPPGTAPYRRTWVGIPVWLWVDNPTDSTWGPISRTATYGGVTVTGKASVTSLTYTSGDGQTIGCGGGGTRFDPAYWANRAAQDSPTCGFRYQHTSKGTPFTVSATSTWSVEWTGGGQSGRIQMPSTTSTTTVRVGELQSVNVTVPGDTYQD